MYTFDEDDGIRKAVSFQQVSSVPWGSEKGLERTGSLRHGRLPVIPTCQPSGSRLTRWQLIPRRLVLVEICTQRCILVAQALKQWDGQFVAAELKQVPVVAS